MDKQARKAFCDIDRICKTISWTEEVILAESFSPPARVVARHIRANLRLVEKTSPPQFKTKWFLLLSEKDHQELRGYIDTAKKIAARIEKGRKVRP